MIKLLIIFLIINFYSYASSSTIENIISQIQLTNNLSFNFIQTVNGKSENGKCTIKYPKKIFCEYEGSKKKIIISNGKSLLIKNQNGIGTYLYPLTKTSLAFLLDKEYLISKINNLEPREIENKYLNFTIIEKNNEINLFFDKKNFSLVGWQTEDIYQNLIITFISSIKINQKIDNRIFIFPKNN